MRAGSGRTVGALFIIALRSSPRVRDPAGLRAWRADRCEGRRDAAGAARACWQLAASRRIERTGDGDARRARRRGGTRARWRFSLGCTRAALTMRCRAELGARWRRVRCTVLAAVLAPLALALSVSSGIRASVRVADWLAFPAFVMILRPTRRLRSRSRRGRAPAEVTARRYGLAGGLAVGGVALIFAPAVSKALSSCPRRRVLVAVVVAAICGDRAPAPRGPAAAFWSGWSAACSCSSSRSRSHMPATVVRTTPRCGTSTRAARAIS